jgi:hypothetical protein
MKRFAAAVRDRRRRSLGQGVAAVGAILTRGLVLGLIAGSALGALVSLGVPLFLGAPRLIGDLIVRTTVCCLFTGTVFGLVAGFCLAICRPRVLLDGALARVIAGAAGALPYVALCVVYSLGRHDVWPSVWLTFALWFGIAGAMYGPWVVHGPLAQVDGGQDDPMTDTTA